MSVAVNAKMAVPLALLLLLVALEPANALNDVYAAVKAAREAAEKAAENAAPRQESFAVPLKKQHVPIVVNNRTLGFKTAYSGSIYIGSPTPQEFTAVFDTGSAHVFIPSSFCNSESCKVHRRYSRRYSNSYVDIDHDGQPVDLGDHTRDQVSIAYGTGEIIGDFVSEKICLAPPSGYYDYSNEGTNENHCTRARVILATEMTTEPFIYFNFDGVIGLGLESLALHPEYHIFGQLARDGRIAPIFSFFLSANDEVDSEITFGGVDEQRFSGEQKWLPITSPEDGFWKVGIRRLFVGDKALNFCEDGACTAIVDTGTSALGVPVDSSVDILYLTAREVPHNDGSVNCRDVAGPPIIFEMEDGITLQLDAVDYSRSVPVEVTARAKPASAQSDVANESASDSAEAASSADGAVIQAAAEAEKEAEVAKTTHVCRATVIPIDMETLGTKAFIWGEPMLQKYYSSYDWKNNRVGFAPAIQRPHEEKAASADAAQDSKPCDDRAEEEHGKPSPKENVVL
eukprot:TRINITY_DN63139_c0_g1_i1.p1 TRINITY_DN63139_c0_g1~~TRINITY_DN63139_c0_g1_i1.p1  ORF type:complete len:514 (+),score=125.75 TRINITY_DN63139_c0_g1_i1:102-1643(+)